MLKLLSGLLNLNVQIAGKIRAIEAFDEATALLRDKKYKESACLYKESAELGHGQGMACYAAALTIGRGVVADGAEAVRWLEGALTEHVPGVRGTLGMLLVTGKSGAPIDLPRGRKLLEEAVALEADTQSAEMLDMMDRKIGLFAKTRRKHQK